MSKLDPQAQSMLYLSFIKVPAEEREGRFAKLRDAGLTAEDEAFLKERLAARELNRVDGPQRARIYRTFRELVIDTLQAGDLNQEAMDAVAADATERMGLGRMTLQAFVEKYGD